MQKTNKLNRLVYAEDVLATIYRERVYMGDVGYIHAKAAVNEAPTVDAVEVVRCKDCKHSEWDCDCGMFLCRHHGCDWNGADHFCSYGERRTDNA